LGTIVAENGKPDPTPMIAWAESTETLGGTLTRTFVRVWPFVVVGGITAGRIFDWPGSIAWLPYIVAFGWALATRARATKVSEAVTKHEGGVRAYIELIKLVEDQKFEAPRLEEQIGRASCR